MTTRKTKSEIILERLNSLNPCGEKEKNNARVAIDWWNGMIREEDYLYPDMVYIDFGEVVFVWNEYYEKDTEQCEDTKVRSYRTGLIQRCIVSKYRIDSLKRKIIYLENS